LPENDGDQATALDMRTKAASQAARSNDRRVFGSFLQEALRFELAIHFASACE